MDDEFTRFEHAGGKRVADKYDSVWASKTRQFIPWLLERARISAGMSVLDVACGPGYVSAAAKQLAAVPTGIDFVEKMIVIAKQMFPGITFVRGDAHHLPFGDASFDHVLTNFGLLHLARPEKACAEACRVLKSGGRFGFTVWAGPEQSAGAKIINDAIEMHADVDVGLPQGPPHYLYGDRRDCEKVLERAGFDGRSMDYETRQVEWHLPTASYLFEAERDAGSAPRDFWRVNHQRCWRRFASRSKTESSDTREETNSLFQWRRTWSWCRNGKGSSPEPAVMP